MPLGLIATSPVAGSRALILPPVHVTRPFLGSSRCSFHSCSLSCSSISTLLPYRDSSYLARLTWSHSKRELWRGRVPFGCPSKNYSFPLQSAASPPTGAEKGLTWGGEASPNPPPA